MPDLRNLQLAPLDDEDRFEELCLALWKRLLNQPATQRNGRRGQRQHGVDLFGRRDQPAAWVAIQCKVRSRGVLSETDILADVESAKQFNPRLSEMIFATTARRDADLQEFARTLTEKNLAEGFFSVTISSWDDIRDEISQEQNLDLCRRFFEGAMINYENIGIAISRVVRLSVGVAGDTDTTYELLLGRTPSADAQASRSFGLNYWRGQHFIANWNEKGIDTFPFPAHFSDFERVFRSKRDAHIIARWLNDNKNRFAGLLYGKDDEFSSILSLEEFQEFAAGLHDDEYD
jgi:hypothetical protein